MAAIGIGNLGTLNTLVFSSLEFLFRYLPLFLLIFFVTPVKYRNFVLFAFSLILYGLGEPKYVFLLLGMCGVNYLFGRSLEEGREAIGPGAMRRQQRRRKKWLFLGVVCNAALLIYFKLSGAMDTNMLLPLGISFYTFKSISYLADVYRGETEAEHSFVRLGVYICCFPQIVSGPIMRYNDALEGLLDGEGKLTRVEDGIKLLVAGLGMKVLLADRLGILWNDIQTVGFESISTPLAWLGAFSYSMELYFDFAGYSLMAVGTGVMIGFPKIRNFDQPYSARSVSEFYRRWHITLGSWFRDYIYIPLGGNRRGGWRTAFNLLAVWAVTGFWHGGGLHFVVWGLVLGLLVILEKFWLGPHLKRHPVLSHLYVLFVIPLTWVLFAAPSLREAGIYFARLFPFFGVGAAVNPGDFGKELSVFWPVLAASVFFCIPQVYRWCEKHRRNTLVILALFAIFWFCVYRMANAANNPFMYANF
ncbi:MAG: MBOAT family O-acyltransferase [Eubacteriales bacterium]|nr:MBOAT family O-acyltransferase [Eubacteriales bacterium]